MDKTNENQKKPKVRLETQYGLTLPVSFINNQLRQACGGLKWTLKAKIASTAILESVLADIMITASESLSKDQSSITPEVLKKAVLQDPTYESMYKKADFNTFKDTGKPKKAKIVEKKEAPKKRQAEEKTPRPKRVRTETTVESQS
jgi:hypothetical protein